MKSKGGSHNSINQGFVSGNKNGGVQLGLAFVFLGKTTSIVKTLVFFEMLQYRRKVIQLGSQPVLRESV
jgi:hypothetical protein